MEASCHIRVLFSSGLALSTFGVNIWRYLDFTLQVSLRVGYKTWTTLSTDASVSITAAPTPTYARFSASLSPG